MGLMVWADWNLRVVQYLDAVRNRQGTACYPSQQNKHHPNNYLLCYGYQLSATITNFALLKT